MITAPIIVLENGDLSVFSNEKELDAELEAIDVQDKRYVAYDATGRRLRLEVGADERITVVNRTFVTPTLQRVRGISNGGQILPSGGR